MTGGIVYTETVVHAADGPYQLAIVQLDSGGRLTGRIEGPHANIGDRVAFAEFRDEVPYFQLAA